MAAKNPTSKAQSPPTTSNSKIESKPKTTSPKEATPATAATSKSATDVAASSAPSAGILATGTTRAVGDAEEKAKYEDFQMMPESVWPPPIFIRKNVSPQERYYMEHRWNSQWSFFDKKATDNKRMYLRLQWIIGVGSVTVPVLVGIRDSNDNIQNGLYIATVIISLAVAISAAIENINGYGDNWRSYRQAAEEMKQEKSLYDVKAGRYFDNPDPFTRFVERCEEIIAQQNGRFIQSTEKQVAQGEQRAQEFLDTHVENEDGVVDDTSPTIAG